jgi:putative YphP/YqiW family bacilliredoxin
MDESMYDRESVRPMHEELNLVDVRSLTTPEEVDAALGKTPGTVLLVVNSVCGCAAGNARPGVTRALQHKVIPDAMVTVFAGVDRSATQRAREYMKGVPPSSPSMGLFKDGALVHVLERRHIEQMTEAAVADNLTRAFEKYCSRPGPSVAPEVFAKLQHARQCGSTVPPSAPHGLR